MLWLGVRICKHQSWGARTTDVFMLTLGLVFIWARFIEPQILRVQETVINQTGIHADVVLIADLHAGPYKGVGYMQRIVEKVNRLDATFNIIAGDFIYKMKQEDLATILAPLSGFNRPTYIVLGNHDNVELHYVEQTLQKLGLISIEHQLIDMGDFQITGVGDRWTASDQPEKAIQQLALAKPTLMVAHNPDSTAGFDAAQVNLVLSGHTHCGQIRVPFIYKNFIPSAMGHDCGLELVNTPSGIIPVFITPGTGETALPMRFLNPPTIDLLHIRQ